MSFPRYPTYKPSGVDWLGDVPAHWAIDRLKWSTRSCQNGIWGDDAQQNENDIPCVRVADFDRQKLQVELVEPTIRNASEKDRMGRTLSRHDLLLEKSGGGETQPVGCVVLYVDHRPAICSNFVARVVLASDMNPSFWRYVHAAAYAVRLNTRSIKQTSGIQNLDSTQYFDEQAAFPPLAEQTRIAEFLDRETAKLDELVAEQRRLMELLKEKRQAVISHAVTRGLNPHAPLKPSGLEWLGAIPSHWEFKKLSHHFRAGKGKNGQMLTKEFCGANPGDFPVYSGQTEDEGVMGTWDQFEFDFGENGVLFSTTVGARAMHLRQLFGKFSLSQNCMVIWPTSDDCITRFFYYHFQPLFQFERALIPEHMQASFRIEDLYSYRIALPPLAEQTAIARHLDAETAKFDALTAEAERAIALLQERRTALISAAVTGQIDVRNLAPGAPVSKPA